MITPYDFTNNALGNTSISLTNGDTQTFEEITESAGGFPSPSGMRVATLEDFLGKLTPEDQDNQTFPVKTGVGILYADGAKETATSLDDAYGYKAGDSEKGMRGVFAYDVRNGKNLFFPIGSSGYGHRKRSINNSSTGSILTGLLRYSCNSRWGYFDVKFENSTYQEGIYDAPLFLDIFRANGALYYIDMNVPNKEKIDGTDIIAWDMNYFTFDLEPITAYNLSLGKDACFVRCIKE